MLLRWLVALLLCLSPALWGTTLTEIVAFHPFEGDRHGDFAGDLVVDLADGSSWKVHPTEQECLAAWQPGDAVHISLRTSWYWFRRQHKFFLNNLDRNECVKVMLVGYGDSPLTVIASSDVYQRDTGELIPVYGTDSNGNQIILTWAPKMESVMDITLSDGTSWVVFDHFVPFRKGATVYKGFNRSKSGVKYFLITCDQREAIWSYIEAAG